MATLEGGPVGQPDQPHHVTKWDNMKRRLIQEIQPTHFQAFIDEFKVEYEPSFLEDEVLGELTETRPGESDQFINRKRKFFDHLEEKYEKEGVITFFSEAGKKRGMNLTIDGDSVQLAEYMSSFWRDWKQTMETARKEGLLLHPDDFIGRKNELREVRSLLERDTYNISGVYICGMYGCGKTTLANEVNRRKTRPYERCFIDLKGARSVTDLYYKLKVKLGMTTAGGEVSWPEIYTSLEDWDTDLLIILDGMEDLLNPFGQQPETGSSTAGDMMEVLNDITKIENSKVKLLLTSQLDIFGEDYTDRYSCELMEEVNKLKKTIQVYHLKNFSVRECKELIAHVAPKASQGMKREDYELIAEACGYNVLGIQVVANYLRTIKIPVQHAIKNIGDLLQDAQKHDESQARRMDKVLQFVFKTLPPELQDTLIRLSVFEGPFSVVGAMKITGKSSTYSMNADLDALIKRNLLEIDSDSGEDRSGVYDPDHLRKNRLTLHSLTFQFINNLCSRDSSREAKREAARLKKIEYYGDILRKLGKLAVENSLEASVLLSEYRRQLKEFISQTTQDDSLPSIETVEDYRTCFRTNVVIEWFLHPKKRMNHLRNKANVAKTKGDVLSFVDLSSWYADTFFDGSLYNVETLDQVCKDIDEKLPLLEELGEERAEISMLCVAHFYYIKARFRYRETEYTEAEKLARKCVKTYKTLLEDDLATARGLNLAGTIHHKLGNHQKSLTYHKKAVVTLDRIRNTYKTEIHFDCIMYYMNVGSQYHIMGYEAADELEALGSHGPIDKMHKLRERKTSKCEKALEWYEKSISTTDRLHMRYTWNHAMMLRNLCTLLTEMERYEQALKSAEDAHDIARRFLSRDTNLMITSNIVVGIAHVDMGNDQFAHNNIDEYYREMERAEIHFHDAARIVLKHGFSEAKRSDVGRLQREYRRLLRSMDRGDEAVTVSDGFEEVLERDQQDTEAEGEKRKFGVDDLPKPRMKEADRPDTKRKYRQGVETGEKRRKISTAGEITYTGTPGPSPTPEDDTDSDTSFSSGSDIISYKQGRRRLLETRAGERSEGRDPDGDADKLSLSEVELGEDLASCHIISASGEVQDDVEEMQETATPGELPFTSYAAGELVTEQESMD